MPSDKKTRVASAESGLSRVLQHSFDLSEGSPGQILQDILHATRLYLGLEIAFLSEFRGERRLFRYVDQAEGLEVVKAGGSDPLDESFCQRVVDGRLPELIKNAREDEQTRTLPATTELGIGTHISVPVRLSDGTIFGTFCSFGFHTDQDLNDRDHALIRVLASIAARLVDRMIEQERGSNEIHNRISTLLREERIHMLWQPIVELDSGCMYGAEALARFPAEPHPSPAEWFEEAATVGLGNELECLAIDKAMAAFEHLTTNQYVSINASAATVLSGEVGQRLADTPLARVVLELTEHDVVEDYKALATPLAELRQQGLRLAVDDAGAGYASFRHILRLEPDFIKLDMSLTRDIDTDVSRRALTTALVQFSRDMDSTLIAEGVETREEMKALADLGIPLAQGFFLHRPQPLDKLAAIIRETAVA